MKRLILAVGTIFVLAGCGGGGSSGGAGTVYETSTNGMKLISNDITPGGTIDNDLTPNGTGESPHLKWSGIPANTNFYFGIVDDPDASNYVHWNFGISDPNLTEIQRDVSGTANLPANMTEGTNSAGTKVWDGPTPPQGERHKYRFCIYGLSSATGINLNTAYDNDTFATNFKSIITGSACFMAFYTGR